MRKHSPFGRKPGWAIRPVIVKSGDDCRQELLAMQLIRAFHGIFQVRIQFVALVMKSNQVPACASVSCILSRTPP